MGEFYRKQRQQACILRTPELQKRVIRNEILYGHRVQRCYEDADMEAHPRPQRSLGGLDTAGEKETPYDLRQFAELHENDCL